MRIELPIFWIIALNLAGWPAIHLGFAWVFSRLPASLFASKRLSLPLQSWERGFYTRVFKVRRWKRLLPDGAPWFKGFSKRNLNSRATRYLNAFIIETRRAEAAHLMMMLAGGVFLLWNPLWADAVMVAYAIAANMPCIIAQRYNRLRLQRTVRSGAWRSSPLASRVHTESAD